MSKHEGKIIEKPQGRCDTTMVAYHRFLYFFAPEVPASLAQCHPTWPNGTRGDYEYITRDYNWRALRVINATDDFMFVQVDQVGG